MTETNLPDDVSKWPEDAHKLLGVGHDITSRELRRIYTGLIRRYKPEHFPEQFRRIREAYELALAESQWRESQAKSANEDRTQPQLVELNQSSTNQPSVRFQSESLDEQLDRIWQQTCDGHESQAYAELLQLVDRHPQRESIYLRLFWMLTVSPGLDRSRVPRDWIVAGLGRCPHSEALRFEYGRQGVMQPGAVLSDDISPWLRDGFESGRFDLLSTRFRAAAILDRFEEIENDVRTMRRAGVARSLVDWIPLLLLASDNLGWSRLPQHLQLFDEWQREIIDASDTHLAIQEQLDRYESLLFLRAAWGEAWKANLDREIMHAVRLGWQGPAKTLRPYLLRLAQHFVQDPSEALERIDSFYPFPDVIAYLAQSYRWQFNPAEREPPLDSLRRLAEALLAKHPSSNYRYLRQHVLRFCLVECVMPRQFAACIENSRLRFRAQVDLAQALTADLPLYCVMTASQCFWG